MAVDIKGLEESDQSQVVQGWFTKQGQKEEDYHMDCVRSMGGQCFVVTGADTTNTNNMFGVIWVQFVVRNSPIRIWLQAEI